MSRSESLQESGVRRFATDGRMVAALAGNVTVGHQGHSAAPPNFRRGVICPHFLGVASGLADYRCRVRKVQSDATSTPIKSRLRAAGCAGAAASPSRFRSNKQPRCDASRDTLERRDLEHKDDALDKSFFCSPFFVANGGDSAQHVFAARCRSAQYRDQNINRSAGGHAQVWTSGTILW
jgi:hypothetical protein